MIEQLLGTALLCCIITAFFYCLFYKIACKSNFFINIINCRIFLHYYFTKAT